MKKNLLLFFSIVLCFICFTGCEKVSTKTGNYKEGTYFGYVEDNYGGSTVATAVVYVDENGLIKSVFLDTVYEKDETLTTKKALETEYGMKKAAQSGNEWYEQANLLEAKVIENQGTSFITLDSDGKTDTVAGVTMKVEALVKALNNALEKAK